MRIYAPHLRGGDVLILVRIPLATASALALAFALAKVSHFLVCTISCEQVVGFLPISHRYMTGT